MLTHQSEQTTARSRNRKAAQAHSLDPAVQAKVESLVNSEIGFMHHESFDQLTRDELETQLAETQLYTESTSPQARSKHDSKLPAYFASLYDTPLLSPQGEAALFRKMNFLKFCANRQRVRLSANQTDSQTLAELEQLLSEASAVRDQIVQSNLRLIVSIARKFADQRVSFDELVSEGNLILLKAVEKFDFSRGFRFSTYVTHSVQRHFYRQFRKFQSRKLAEVSLFEDSLADLVSQPFDDEEIPLTGQIDLTQLLLKIDECLDDRERYVLLERFGLGPSGIARTLQSLAQDLGVCKERVRQLHHKALEQLRTFVDEWTRGGSQRDLNTVAL